MEVDFETLSAKATEFEARAAGVLDNMAPSVAMSSTGVHFLASEHKAWGLSLIELAFSSEMKTFLSHAHCRALVRTVLHQTSQLALPQHTTVTSIFLQAASLPLGYTSLLDCCIDLRRDKWLKAKRRLTFAEQRKRAPLEVRGRARVYEFLHVPRVKLLLRNALRSLYTLLFTALLLVRADMRPLAPDASMPWWALAMEGLFLWWTINLLLDLASQSVRQRARTTRLVGWTVLDFLTLTLVLVALIFSWRSYLQGTPSAGTHADGGIGSLLGRQLAHDDEGAGEIATRSRSAGAPSRDERWSTLLLGLCAIPICIRMLRLLAEHRILGVLMIILTKMMYDVSLFLVIFSTIASGFGLAFIALLSMEVRSTAPAPLVLSTLTRPATSPCKHGHAPLPHAAAHSRRRR